METRRTDSGIRISDANGTSIDIGTDGWEYGGDPPSVRDTLPETLFGPEEPVVTIEGVTNELSFPKVVINHLNIETDESESHYASNKDMLIPDSSSLVGIDASIRVFIRFDGPARFTRIDDRVRLQFPEPTAVSIGVEESVDTPAGVVTVPKTPSGVAAGLSAAASSIEVTTPDRSWPSLRNHPPLIEFGEELHIPPEIASERAETEIDLHVPEELAYVLTGSSLAHYLGAEIVVESGIEPRLSLGSRSVAMGRSSSFPASGAVSPDGPWSSGSRTGSVGVSEEEEGLVAFAGRAAHLLRRVFFLDCLARAAGEFSRAVATFPALDEIGLDAEQLYDASIRDRVCRYVDAPFERVSEQFPEWHLSMAVVPTYEVAATLPRLFQSLPMIVPARGERLSEERAVRSTDTGDEKMWPGYFDRETSDNVVHVRENYHSHESVEQYRSHDPTEWSETRPRNLESALQSSESPTVRTFDRDQQRVASEPKWAKVHGRFGDCVPVDGFHAIPAGFDNRDRYTTNSSDNLSVVIVVNGPDENKELTRACEHYRRRATELPLDVCVRTNVTVAELARAFESRTDVLHFVGHHDEHGLECADGFFSAETLSVSNARTFFLNACGSHPQGVTLIEKGSVAGGVTYREVIDEMAAEVGTTFARLIVEGFSVGEAMQLAREQVVAASDYVVVGDGTHVVTQSDMIASQRNRIVRQWTDDGTEMFELLVRVDGAWMTGAVSRRSLDDHGDSVTLFGQPRRYEVTRAELESFLKDGDAPVRYQGELLWPEELWERLDEAE